MFDTLFRLADHELDAKLTLLFERDRVGTTELLAHIAESDARRRYAPAGYPSMHAYCMGRFGLTDDVALKHLRVARTARKFPAIWPMLHDGRLSPSLVVMLVPHLEPGSADELLAAAAHRSRAELERLLVARRPKPDVPAVVEPISRNCQQFAVAPGPPAPPLELTPPDAGEPAAPRPRVEPLAPERSAVRFTIDEESHDLLRQAQALTGHAVAPGDLPELFKRAMRELVRVLEKRMFGNGTCPHPRTSKANRRHVPGEVRRAVHERDGGRCTFVSDDGHRCESRQNLEFDHVQPVARGGQSTVENLRLRCRAHNQYEAERAFGAGFMTRKRESASGERPRREAAGTAGSTPRSPALQARHDDLHAALRGLGFREDEARRGVAMADATPEASLEACLRRVLPVLARPVALRGERVARSTA